MIEIVEEEFDLGATIKVIGVGGALPSLVG